RLEVLTHESLPDRRLGRGDGNFFLNEVEVDLTTPAEKKAQKLTIKSARADYAQPNYAIQNAIDGKPKTAWAVDGDIQRGSRTALFIFEAPVEVPEGSTISVRLTQTSKEQQQTFG